MRSGVAAVIVIGWLAACAERAPEPVAKRAPVAHAPADAAPSATTVPPPSPSPPPVRLFAKRFVAKVREAPDKQAFRVGYLRGGAVLQAKTHAPIGYEKCRKGWYELETGGFVCSTADVVPFTGRRLPERQARQPDLDAPLPYPYAYSRRRNTPMYRRLPTDEEAALYERRQAPPGPVDLPAPSAAIALPAPSPTPTDPALAEIAGELQAASAAELAGDPVTIDSADTGVPTLASLMGEQGSVLLRRMERGFYVSLDREMTKGTRAYFRTQSNGFIPNGGLALIEPGTFHGVELDEQGAALPIGFVIAKRAVAYTRNERGLLRPAPPPSYHETFAITGEVELRGKLYYEAADGRLFRPRDVTRIAARDKPAEIGPQEKWIDVDLTTQSLVAYVGARPVFATLISSGRIKDPLDPLKNFETPTGAFRITAKHLTATMDGDHAIDGPYSIEDVPYVMYFQLAYALHSAFWHDGFGRPRSHGCINLSPLDAKWVFAFADPELPRGWHGTYPKPGAPGTRLYIHGQTPVR